MIIQYSLVFRGVFCIDNELGNVCVVAINELIHNYVRHSGMTVQETYFTGYTLKTNGFQGFDKNSENE